MKFCGRQLLKHLKGYDLLKKMSFHSSPLLKFSVLRLAEMLKSVTGAL